MAYRRQKTNRQASFAANWRWQEKYLADVNKILKANLKRIATVRVGTLSEDMKEATDFVVQIEGGTVAVRIRDAVQYRFRDFTIRATVPTGYQTELEKLRDGYGDWYLYAWVNDSNIIEYLLIDLSKVRSAGLLDKKRQLIGNKDGTQFVAIGQDELRAADAIAHHAHLNLSRDQS